MSEIDPKKTELISLARSLAERRTSWEPTWDEVVKFCSPGRSFYAPDSRTKSKTYPSLYNSAAVLAAAKASRGFQEYTCSLRSEWFALQPEDASLARIPGVGQYLEDCQRIMSGHFAKDNLYVAIGELIPDGWTVGTGTMYIEEDIEHARLIFQTRHPKAVWLAENSYGEVDIIVEDLFMTLKSALQRFGDRLPEKTRDQASKDPFGDIIVRHIVMPMDDKYKDYAQGKFNPAMAFVSIWMLRDTQDIIDAGGYWEFPYATWRFQKNDGEEYGRCPGMNALSDILAGNQMGRSRLQLGNLIADPPMDVPEELEGSDWILPGFHIYTKSSMKPIQPVAFGANYPITMDNEERQDRLINEHFSVPIFEMLQQAERQMTAREVMERMGEKAANLGPIVARWEIEVLQKVIQRTYNLMLRAGMFPAPPKVYQEAGKEGIGFKVEFVGLLAQMQRRYFETNKINDAIGYIQAVGQLFPGSADIVNEDALMRNSLESAGAPASVIRSEEEVGQLRQARQQAQAAAIQQQQAMQQQQSMMQNIDKLGKTPEPGSPADQMNQMDPAGMGVPA